METPHLYLFVTENILTEIHPASISNADEAIFSNNFDYEMLFDGTKRVYFDIGLRLNRVEVVFRSGIEFNGSNMEWIDVFNIEFLLPLTTRAVELCYEAYSEFCYDNNISYPDNFDINSSLTESITKSIIERYVNYRSHDDVDNAYLLQNIGIECKTDTDSVLLIQCTFAILDEILFENKAFNNARNRNTFSDIIALPRYLTIKNNCMLIEVDDIELNFLDTILFLQCLDCALQMLVSDKSDIITLALETKGIDNEMVRSYIKIGTEEFAQFREMLKRSNARITNLEILPDWNSLIQ
jgi:hypothetical protein